MPNENVVIEGAEAIAARALAIPYEEGTFFSVVFIKKDGTVREMTCRRGVTKYLRGGELGYNAKEHKLLPVYDVNKPEGEGYRSIPCDRLLQLKFKGTVYRTPEYQAKL